MEEFILGSESYQWIYAFLGNLFIFLAVNAPIPNVGNYTFSDFRKYYFSFRGHIDSEQFISRIILLTVLLVLAQCSIGFFFPNYSDYLEYKNAYAYITSLSPEKRTKLQYILSMQRDNLNKKYSRKAWEERADSANTIGDKNRDRYGVYLNPLRVDEYFDENAYSTKVNIHYWILALFCLPYISCIYRRYFITERPLPVLSNFEKQKLKLIGTRPCVKNDWEIDLIHVGDTFSNDMFRYSLGDFLSKEKKEETIGKTPTLIHLCKYTFSQGFLQTANNKIITVASSVEGAETPRGIRIGISKVEDVIKNYGNVTRTRRDGNLMQYIYSEDSCDLAFSANAKGIIVKIIASIPYW